MNRAVSRALAGVSAALAAMAAFAPTSGAQTPAAPATTRALSLDDALALATRTSEALAIAQSAVRRADGQFLQARSQLLPQVNGTLNYQRQLQNQFAAIAALEARRNPPPAGGGSGGGSGSGSTDNSQASLFRVFASPNNVIAGVTASQTVFAAGRVTAGTAAASAARRAAELGLTSAAAQVKYDVAQAYFDAAVADQLLAIADSSLGQAERALKQTTLARQVGTSAEFDLLRARVARDNLRPQVYSALTQREGAFNRLKALLNLPLDQPLALSTPVTEPDTAALVQAVAADLAAMRQSSSAVTLMPIGDTSTTARLAVRQSGENVTAQRHLLSAARASRFPAIQVSTNYQRFAYPDDQGRGWTDYFPNWTVSAGLSVPLFTGRRLQGDIEVARANLIDAEQRFQQAREGASIESRQAVNELRQAQASYLSSLGTDEQAARAYRIAEVRYAEGVSTQLELIESRNQLAQARANRVTAARTLALAQLKLQLLKDLPLGAGAGQMAAPGGAMGAPGQAPGGAGAGGAGAGNRATGGAAAAGPLASVQSPN
ncbi:MAG: TolC family protein [Gemmatimonadaceae bacterium]|jgi:outer membrane protein TolC|nr:TolC family protein [Gemmatimonadaceae bacterium]